MNIKKKLAVLAIVTATGLFAAASVSDIDALVGKINNAKDAEVKSKLLKQLDDELDAMDKKDLPRAHEIVNTKLKQSKVTTK